MTLHQKTQILIDAARDVLEATHPMTVRQVYYQLVSRQVIRNNRGQYQAVSNALKNARKDGTVPWDWIEDRLRRPRQVSMWSDLSEFGADVLNSYRRDVWSSQPRYVEVWLEKDALSGIFEDILAPYGVTLNVGRGYDGWTSIRNAAKRYGKGDNAAILYFGDFDPSGEDMVRSLGERLGFFNCYPKIMKCALVAEDIRRYNLPPDFAKESDTRHKKFVEKHGDISVELDALPADVLQSRLIQEIENLMDLAALEQVETQQEVERHKLRSLFSEVSA